MSSVYFNVAQIFFHGYYTKYKLHELYFIPQHFIFLQTQFPIFSSPIPLEKRTRTSRSVQLFYYCETFLLSSGSFLISSLSSKVFFLSLSYMLTSKVSIQLLSNSNNIFPLSLIHTFIMLQHTVYNKIPFYFK